LTFRAGLQFFLGQKLSFGVPRTEVEFIARCLCRHRPICAYLRLIPMAESSDHHGRRTSILSAAGLMCSSARSHMKWGCPGKCSTAPHRTAPAPAPFTFRTAITARRAMAPLPHPPAAAQARGQRAGQAIATPTHPPTSTSPPVAPLAPPPRHATRRSPQPHRSWASRPAPSADRTE